MATIRAETVTSDATNAVSNINDAPTGSVHHHRHGGGRPERSRRIQRHSRMPTACRLRRMPSPTSGSAIRVPMMALRISRTPPAKPTRWGMRMWAVKCGFRSATPMATARTRQCPRMQTVAVGNVNDLPTGSVTIDGTVRGDERLTADITALQDLDGLPADAKWLQLPVAAQRWQWRL